jgi:sugar transferase (PEP-CTERM/EpsH1 system associated)
MIIHRIPYPPDKGDKIRSYHEFRVLLERGWKIHLCTFIDDPSDVRHKATLASKCVSSAFIQLGKVQRYGAMFRALICGRPLSVGAFYSKKALKYVQDVVSAYPIRAALCFSSSTADYLLGDGLGGAGFTRVMDLVDVDSDKWRLYAARSSAPLRWLYDLEFKRLAAYEERIVNRFDAVTLVSEAEAAFLKTRVREKAKVHSVPNGVDTAFFHPDSGNESTLKRNGCTLVFCGAMDYYPNVDAVVWFATEVLPKVRQRLGDVEFHVVGARPAKQVLDLERHAGVKVLGRVDDVRPYVWNASISIAPLRVARGIQNKVLEAMAMSKPIVATEQAFEGIEAAPGRDLMVARDEPGAFADAIVGLWENPEKAGSMGENARKVVEECYDWNARLSDLDGMLSNQWA